MAIDFGASLDKILEAYTKVSEVRAAKDIAKYQTAGATQQALLNLPQGYTASEAYAVGNAANPAYQGAYPGALYPQSANNNNLLIYGAVGLVAAVVLIKVLK
jgi:NADPH:quinone reductase-like Zn-dependent oxidoreductase